MSTLVLLLFVALAGAQAPNECPKAACCSGLGPSVCANFPEGADCCRACGLFPDEDSCGCCDGGVNIYNYTTPADPHGPPMYNECPKAACSFGPNFPADTDCCRACKERPDEDSCGCCDYCGAADNSSRIGIAVILMIVFAVAFLVALAYICGKKDKTSVIMVNADRQQSYHQPIGGGFCPDAAEDNYPSTAVVVTAAIVDDKTDMTNVMATAQIVASGGSTTNDGRTHTTKFCTNCGILLNANENQNRFCGNCGAQIRRELERECE